MHFHFFVLHSVQYIKIQCKRKEWHPTYLQTFGTLKYHHIYFSVDLHVCATQINDFCSSFRDYDLMVWKKGGLIPSDQ
jgi:hypothetical protein